MKKNKLGYFIISLSIVFLLIIISVNADSNDIEFIESPYANFRVIDNGGTGGKRDVQIAIDSISAGKRLSTIEYCTSVCTNDDNWHDVNSFDTRNKVTSLANHVGSVDMTLFVYVPEDDIKLRANFVDFEPMNISYAKYNLSTTDEREYRDVYVDGITDFNNYDSEFTDIVTGYIGGDIILPSRCTNNGCLLKVSFDADDYAAINSRLNTYNQEQSEHEKRPFIEVGNHIEGIDLPTDTVIYIKDGNQLYVETEGNTKSIYLVINKFFYQQNRSDFVIADNKNRILAEDYIGLDYAVDGKYFDEGSNFGFLTFNQFNNYEASTEIFYGTPVVNLYVDSVIAPALTSTGEIQEMGTIKHPYNKIVSKNQEKYPIDAQFKLSINSFYEQDYIIPIELKNDDEHVQDIKFNLARFAFGGNAGSLLLVDDQGINCRREDQHPNCTGENIYISTEYRGLYDTFYSTGESTTINAFEISNQRRDEDIEDKITGDIKNNLKVYARNEEFNPWAVAIFYHDDTVVATKSIDLSEEVKVEGFSEDIIENSQVNGIAKDFGGTLITNYNSDDYNIFGYGLGYKKPIGRIKYFDENVYKNANINQTLILASKKDILDNNINRIALFLTNGELKPDSNNFPELTYGVGEGKVFEIDGRTFEELGGAQ